MELHSANTDRGLDLWWNQGRGRGVKAAARPTVVVDREYDRVMRRCVVAIAGLLACGGKDAKPTAISNQPGAMKAPTTEPVVASPECKAAVAKKYDDGHHEYRDPKTGNRVIVTDSDVCGLVVEPVFFKLNSSEIVAKSGADDFAAMLACMYQTGGDKLQLEVIGHATPDEPNPEALGLARAQNLARYFTDCGVPTLGFEPRSAGDREPAFGSDYTTEEGRAKNRRVDFLIIKRISN